MSIRKNSLFMMLGVSFRLLLSIASIPILIHFLGIEQYGIWSVVNAQVGIFLLAEFGISMAITHFLSKSYARNELDAFYSLLGTSLLIITVLGLLATVIYFALIPAMMNSFSKSVLPPSTLYNILFLSSSLVLFRLYSLALSAIEGALLRFDIQAQIETAGWFILQIGIILFSLSKASLVWLFGWSLIAWILTVLIHIYVISKFMGISLIKIKIGREDIKPLLKFGMYQWISNIGSVLFSQADKVIVNLFLGPALVGVYSAATTITTKINEVSAATVRVIQPVVSKYDETDQAERLKTIFVKMLRINGVMVFVLALVLSFWPDYIAKFFMAGTEASLFIQILPILTLIYSLYSLGATGYYTLIGLGKPNINAIWGLLSGMGVCICLFLFVPVWGIMGAIWANVAYVIVLGLNFKAAKDLQIHARIFIPLSGLLIFIMIVTSLFYKLGFLLFPIQGRIALFGIIGASFSALILGKDLIQTTLNRLLESLQTLKPE